MKPIRLIAIAFAWLAGTAAWVGAYEKDAPKKSPFRTDVIFFEPEKFTDATDTYAGGEKSREAVLDQLRSYLRERAQQYVGEGQKLTVTITDVDLAGEFEPWRGGSAHDVRIVKEIYPPAIKLAFKLVGTNNETEKAGERNLRDLSFQQTASPVNTTDPLRYEKAMIDAWLRAEFPKPKKS